MKKKLQKKRRNDVVHYVKNDDFLPLLVEFRKQREPYIEKLDKGEIDHKDLPPIPDEIGIALYKIANKLSNSSNFANYPFKEEMIADALANCIRAINNFDPEKSNNPFAYFTQICYWAYVRRIKDEQKYLYEKYKSIEIFLNEQEGSQDTVIQKATMQYGSDYADLNMREYIENYEAKLAKKKIEKKKPEKKLI